MSVKILLTGAGSGIGEAVYKSLRMSRLPIEITGTDMSGFNSGSFRCDKAYKVPCAGDEKYAKAIIDICGREKTDMVISGSDTELPVLAKIREQGLINSTVLTGSVKSVNICRSKKECYKFFSEKDMPFVHTAEYAEVDKIIQKYGFPIIGKPAGGSGSIGVKVFFKKDELELLEDKNNYVFQEYLIPDKWNIDKGSIKREDIFTKSCLVQKDEISIQVLLGKQGEILGTFMSKNVLKLGIPIKIFPFRDSLCEEMAVKMAKELAHEGMEGPVNLQCKITGRGPVFFEINPRFTGITSVRAELGFNEVEACIRHYLLNVARHGIEGCLNTDYTKAVCRYLDEVTYPKDKLNELENNNFVDNN